MAGVEARLSRPTLGRLGGGVPQPPGPVVSTEYLAARRELPIWSHRQELVDAVQNKQVVLVTGRLENGFFEKESYTVIKQSIGEKPYIELNSITKLFHPNKGLIRYCNDDGW